MKGKEFLYNMYNATSTKDDETGELETYENWLEYQLLRRINQEQVKNQEFEQMKNNIHYLQGLVDGYGGEEPLDELPYGFKNINEVWQQLAKLKGEL